MKTFSKVNVKFGIAIILIVVFIVINFFLQMCDITIVKDAVNTLVVSVLALIQIIPTLQSWFTKKDEQLSNALRELEIVELLFNDKQYLDVITKTHSIISILPLKGEAYFLRGQAYYRTGQLDRAKKDFDKVIELQPGTHLLIYIVLKYYAKWDILKKLL